MSSVLARSGWFIASTSPVQVRVRSALARQSWGYYCTCGCAVSFYAPVGNLRPPPPEPPLCVHHIYASVFPLCKQVIVNEDRVGRGPRRTHAACCNGVITGVSVCSPIAPLFSLASFFFLFLVVLLCSTPHVWMMPNVVGYPSCRFHPSCFHILQLMKLYGRESITGDPDRIAFAI